MKKKKVPLRMCVGCRQMKPKKELIRIVRDLETGKARIDESGRSNGRGAYICPGEECVDSARKSARLEKALDVKIAPELYDILKQQIKEAR